MSDLIKREDAIKAVAEVLSLNRFASFRNIKDFGRFAERMLRNVPSADRPQKVIAQVTFDEEKLRQITKEAVERFKEEYEITDRPQGEWIDCKEPPSTDRNVFIAYGTDDMKSVCIGHYEHDMKLWYEDKNFFAKPMYDATYWCEIPQFPTRMKGADDE